MPDKRTDFTALDYKYVCGLYHIDAPHINAMHYYDQASPEERQIMLFAVGQPKSEED